MHQSRQRQNVWVHPFELYTKQDTKQVDTCVQAHWMITTHMASCQWVKVWPKHEGQTHQRNKVFLPFPTCIMWTFAVYKVSYQLEDRYEECYEFLCIHLIYIIYIGFQWNGLIHTWLSGRESHIYTPTDVNEKYGVFNWYRNCEVQQIVQKIHADLQCLKSCVYDDGNNAGGNEVPS